MTDELEKFLAWAVIETELLEELSTLDEVEAELVQDAAGMLARLTALLHEYRSDVRDLN